MALTGKQRRYLRGLAHHLKPVVLTGASGVTEQVLTKVATELENHELIKVKVNDGPDIAREVASDVAARVSAELVQVIGKTLVLYKRRAKEPEIRIPKSK